MIRIDEILPGEISLSDISLEPMTLELCHRYYQKFVADESIYMDMSSYRPFVYKEEWVENYFNRQIEMRRVFLAVMRKQEPIGEIIFKEIDNETGSCSLSVHLQNDTYKGQGIGTKAEKLALQYAADQLGIRIINADVVLKNKRSQHVLEKIGFQFMKQEGIFRYYQIDLAKKKQEQPKEN